MSALNWSDLRTALAPELKTAAPALLEHFGGPWGALIGTALAATLNTAPTPDAVANAISTRPAAAQTAADFVRLHNLADVKGAAVSLGLSAVQQVAADVATGRASPILLGVTVGPLTLSLAFDVRAFIAQFTKGN